MPGFAIAIPRPCGGSGKPWYFQPPTLADFPNVFGSAPPGQVFDDPDVGLCLAASPFNTCFRCKTISPTAPFQATLHLKAGAVRLGAANRSIVLGNGAQFFWWGWDSRASVHFMRFSTTGYDGFENLPGWDGGNPEWFRISYDPAAAGGTIVYSYSNDGKLWVSLDTYTGATSYLGGQPTQLGVAVGADGYSGQVPMSVDHWSDTL